MFLKDWWNSHDQHKVAKHACSVKIKTLYTKTVLKILSQQQCIRYGRCCFLLLSTGYVVNIECSVKLKITLP